MIDENTRAVYCESVGNPAGNVADIEGLAKVAHKHGVPLIVDNTVATPILLRPIEYGADVVVHSMTKFMGGHGTTLGGMIVDSGKFPWRKYPEKFYMFNRPETGISRRRLHRSVRRRRLRRALPHRVPAQHRRDAVAVQRLSCFCRASKPWPCASSATWRTPAKSRSFFARTRMVAWVNYAGFPDSPSIRWRKNILAIKRCSLLTFGVKGGFEAGTKVLRRLQAFQAHGEHGRRQIALLPSRIHHASPTYARRTAKGRRDAGNDSSERRHRAYRRHPRRFRTSSSTGIGGSRRS